MLGLSKLEAYLILAGLLILAAACAGGWCYHLGGNAADERWEAKQAKAVAIDFKALQDGINQSIALAQGTASAVAGIKVNHITSKGVLEREIQTNTIYSNDCLPESGRLQWNAISAGRGVLPASAAGREPDKRGVELPKGMGTASAGRQSRDAAAKP